MRTALFAGLLMLAPVQTMAETVDQVAVRYKLAGEILVAKGDKLLLDKGYGDVAPGGGAKHKTNARWRLASITKQVTATLVVQEADRESYSLDKPIMFAGLGVTELNTLPLSLRQLLTHHTGLANPDSTPALAGGVPAFYTRAAPDTAFCFSKPAQPGSDFAYNNCDYLVAAMTLETTRWPAGMAMAKPGQTGVPGFIGGKPEPHYELSSFGAAGGLIGTARSVFAFDRALMTGKLLTPTLREELWKAEGGRSYQALGQWVFPGQLKGCTAPKRIVQRDGEIGGVQTRNFILPDDDLVVIIFTNRGSDDFPVGEVWQGKGFSYDLLSAAACA